jgi:hypothetical protein
MNARRPPSQFSILIRRISARRPASIRGGLPGFRDFQRQQRRKPARCQRTMVSGRTIIVATRMPSSKGVGLFDIVKRELAFG